MSRPGCSDPSTVYPVIRAGADSLILAAPAKLNLFLEVVGKRDDGYHELETLMVAVDLFDTLELRAEKELSLRCEPPGLPTGADNLVIRAGEVLRAAAGRPDLGAAIRLTKRIPTRAGLGGGSSDAAATLVGLNALGKLALTNKELAAMAASVGSDVAFFLTPPVAWCTGRGEVVSPEPVSRVLDFVLVCPAVGLGTAEVYAHVRVPAVPRRGDELRAAVRSGDPEAVGRALFNRLEEPAFALAPQVRRVRDRLLALGPCGAQMTGSGSAVFAVCRSRAEAVRIATAYHAAGPPDHTDDRVFVVRSLTP